MKLYNYIDGNGKVLYPKMALEVEKICDDRYVLKTPSKEYRGFRDVNIYDGTFTKKMFDTDVNVIDHIHGENYFHNDDRYNYFVITVYVGNHGESKMNVLDMRRSRFGDPRFVSDTWSDSVSCINTDVYEFARWGGTKRMYRSDGTVIWDDYYWLGRWENGYAVLDAMKDGYHRYTIIDKKTYKSINGKWVRRSIYISGGEVFFDKSDKKCNTFILN